MANMNLACQLEAVLFYKSEPVKISVLAKILGADESAIKEASNELKSGLVGRGIRLLENDNSLSLVTAGEVSELIENITKEELSRDIGKAGLETLAIILYQGEVARADIDYIRGVNSSFILRHLLVRGLVARETSPTDQRSFIYRPTTELLATLGLENKEQLPEFAEIKTKIASFMSASGDKLENITANTTNE